MLCIYDNASSHMVGIWWVYHILRKSGFYDYPYTSSKHTNLIYVFLQVSITNGYYLSFLSFYNIFDFLPQNLQNLGQKNEIIVLITIFNCCNNCQIWWTSVVNDYVWLLQMASSRYNLICAQRGSRQHRFCY